MTGGQFGEVDFDLLADYVGGALDGTPGESEVARLIASDTAWAQAYADLTTAVDAVRDDLAGWGAVPDPMPATVADRLTAALADATAVGAPVRDAVELVDPGERSGRRPVGVPHGGVASSGPGRAAARSRRRWSRLAGPVAVAAAVTAFAGFGLTRLTGSNGADSSGGAAVSGAGAEHAGANRSPASTLAAPQVSLAPGALTPISSGTDYIPATLAERVAALGGQRINTESGSKEHQNGASEQPRASVAYGLERLSDRAALAGCLDAVAREHDNGTLTVDIVDYARFEGSPALVIAFADRSGTRWAWAVGPECGLPGAGTDKRHHARVG